MSHYLRVAHPAQSRNGGNELPVGDVLCNFFLVEYNHDRTRFAMSASRVIFRFIASRATGVMGSG